MVKIFILTKRSIFLIVLVSSTFNPLLAVPLYEDSTKQTLQKAEAANVDIENILISKGLQKDAAAAKVGRLFQKNRDFAAKIAKLYNDKELKLSKKTVLNAFAEYALFDKSCDLNSYDSLLGFVQNIKSELSKKELNAIRSIADFS